MYFKVEYELATIVEGRNLRYEARYPAGGKVQKSQQVQLSDLAQTSLQRDPSCNTGLFGLSHKLIAYSQPSLA